jgi:hypothetical protein
MSGDGARVCKTCGQIKPLSCFEKHSYGHRHTCSECRNTYMNNHYHNNDYVKDNNRKSFNKMVSENKICFQEYMKDKKCVDCGISDQRVLDFDHINGDKKHNISKMVNGSFLWITILAEIAKCEIRCANCHRIKTYERRRENGQSA